MKKSTAFLGALLLSSAFVAPVHAADTQDIATTKTTETSTGTVWGSLSGTALKQLKVTVPIKLDFAVSPDGDMVGTATPAKANKVVAGDYKIKVAVDSEVGVELQNINIKKIGAWSLDSKAGVDALAVSGVDETVALEKGKTVALNLAGKEVGLGDTKYAADEFKVAISAEKSLNLTGTAGKVWIKSSTAATPEEAFSIVYTIAQK